MGTKEDSELHVGVTAALVVVQQQVQEIVQSVVSEASSDEPGEMTLIAVPLDLVAQVAVLLQDTIDMIASQGLVNMHAVATEVRAIDVPVLSRIPDIKVATPREHVQTLMKTLGTMMSTSCTLELEEESPIPRSMMH